MYFVLIDIDSLRQESWVLSSSQNGFVIFDLGGGQKQEQVQRVGKNHLAVGLVTSP